MARLRRGWGGDGRLPGAHGYVSPTWYQDRSINVPTWNYAAVHAYGRANVIESDAEVERLLTALTATHESGPRPWSPAELDPQRFGQLRKAIVAFTLPIDRLEGKLKMNQNRTPADRRGVREALRRRGDAESAELAALVPRIEAAAPAADRPTTACRTL